MAMISSPVGAAEVAAAHDVLRDVLPPTPLLHSRVLSERLGGPVFLKCENL
jgi:threonine dehydratase